MNWDLMVKALNVLAILASTGLNAYLFFRSKKDERFAQIDRKFVHIERTAEADREAVRSAIIERRAQVAKLERNATAIDERLRQSPTHKDLSEIREALGLMRAEMASISERSRNTSDSLRRIETHLMER